MSKVRKEIRIDTNKIPDHYLMWWLGREVSELELDVLKSFMVKYGTKYIKEEGKTITYRYFINDTFSVHILFYKKRWGISVNAHIDLLIHHNALFNNQTLDILKVIGRFLNKMSLGTCFLLPPQEKEFR